MLPPPPPVKNHCFWWALNSAWAFISANMVRQKIIHNTKSILHLFSSFPEEGFTAPAVVPSRLTSADRHRPPSPFFPPRLFRCITRRTSLSQLYRSNSAGHHSLSRLVRRRTLPDCGELAPQRHHSGLCRGVEYSRPLPFKFEHEPSAARPMQRLRSTACHSRCGHGSTPWPLATQRG